MKNLIIIKRMMLLITCILLFLSTNAQTISEKELNIQKQIGYGLETIGLCFIAYSNINAHYESRDLKISNYNIPDYHSYYYKKALVNYTDDFSAIEKKNLKNTIIGGALILGGISLNVLPYGYNQKYRNKQNVAILFESIGTGILIGSVIKRQNVINMNINLWEKQITYSGASVEQKMEAEVALFSHLNELQESRLGIFTGGAILFYGVLTHFTSLRFMKNVKIYSNGNNISMVYNF